MDVSESIATLTIDRPAVKNALNLETVAECRAALEALTADANAGALIITGAGNPRSCLARTSTTSRARTRRRSGGDQLVAVRGDRAVSAADHRRDQRLRARRRLRAGARLRHPRCGRHREVRPAELGLGIIPGAGGTQRLPRTSGSGWAKHLMLTGEIIDAKQALAIGLVTAIMPASQLQVRARELAKSILRRDRWRRASQSSRSMRRRGSIWIPGC